MAPPVAAIVVVSIVTTTVVAFAVKEAWEPHIKPQLKNAQNNVKTWWGKRPRMASPIIAQRRRRRDDGPGSSDAPPPADAGAANDENRPPPASRFESYVNSAFQLPSEGNTHLRQRNTGNNQTGEGTSNENVEMTEMANPWIYQPPQSPVFSSTQKTTTIRDSAATNVDPFADINAPVDSYGFIQPAQAYDPRLQGGASTSLGLSFVPPPISVSHPPSSSSPSSHTQTRTQRGDNNANLGTASPGITHMTSPASVFSWVDATGSSPHLNFSTAPGTGIENRGRSMTLDDSEDAFSIGSYDDLSTSRSRSVAGNDENENEDDERSEPMSPPHHSASERGGSGSGGSESGWESVGSPKSSASDNGVIKNQGYRI